MKTLVLYHGGACADGFCAAWVLRSVFPDAEFRAVNYGEPAPDVVGFRRVIVADFSFKRPQMLFVITRARGAVTVLDHHKTAEAELKGIEAECYLDTLDCLPRIVFDMGKSGARLAWEEYGSCDAAGRLMAPWLVDYTEDRDLWLWKLPHSREVNCALRSYPFDFDVWDRLSLRDPMDLVPEGAAILRREQQLIDTHVRNASEIELGGHKVLAVNATTMHSEIAGELAKDRPFGAVYFDRADGQRIWSLRSREGGVDVSEVAARHGGGGHRNAAGFQTGALL